MQKCNFTDFDTRSVLQINCSNAYCVSLLYGFDATDWTLCLKLSYRHVKIVDMSNERTGPSMRTTLFLLILVRCILALSS